ncbi:dicarboxylate/amino acid:cation symporter [Intestinibacter sp.]|uniref:dicarboxylate/amino acid:cation symporter n=1 Tax=Intestinibacter sp. TaxID=1965304 RepID=UPI003F176979
MGETKSKKMKLSTKMLIGMVLGIILGAIFQSMHLEEFSANYIAPLGNIFISALKMLVIPLIISSLVTGLTGLGDNYALLGRICVKAVIFFLVSMALTTTIGIVAVNVVGLGEGMNLVTDEVLSTTAADLNVMTMIEGFVPSNIVQAMSENNMIQCIVFSAILAIAIVKSGEEGQSVREGLSKFSDVMCNMLMVVMEYAPIGVCALMANTVATSGLSIVISLLGIIVLQICVMLSVFLLLYAPIMVFYCKIPVTSFFKLCSPSMLVAVSTGASMAALSLNMEASKKLGCSEDISDMIVIMGNTMNMAGLAMHIGLAANFVANAYGIELSIYTQVIIVMSSVLMAMGMAGIPGATPLVSAVFSQVGLPQAGVGLIAGIDQIGTMIRTVMNITGDIVAACAICVSEKKFEFGKAKISSQNRETA